MTDEEQERKWKPKLWGICLSLISGLTLLTMNALVQKMKLHFSDVLFTRALFQSFIGLVLSLFRGQSLWIKEVDDGQNLYRMRILLFVFGFLAATFNTTDLIAITFMPLGDAMTIILSAVLPVVVLAALFLKERLRLYKILCSLLVLTGIVLVLRPPFLFQNSVEHEKKQSINTSIPLTTNGTLSEKLEIFSKLNDSGSDNYYIGAIAALVAMFSVAGTRTVIKFLLMNNSTKSFAVLLCYRNLANLIVAMILPAFVGNQRILFPSVDVKMYDIRQWLGIVAVTLIGFIHYATRYMAIKLISPTLISFIRASEIVLAYIIQLAILGTKPYATSLIGSGLVMVACIAIIFESLAVQRMNPKIQFLF